MRSVMMLQSICSMMPSGLTVIMICFYLLRVLCPRRSTTILISMASMEATGFDDGVETLSMSADCVVCI